MGSAVPKWHSPPRAPSEQARQEKAAKKQAELRTSSAPHPGPKQFCYSVFFSTAYQLRTAPLPQAILLFGFLFNCSPAPHRTPNPGHFVIRFFFSTAHQLRTAPRPHALQFSSVCAPTPTPGPSPILFCFSCSPVPSLRRRSTAAMWLRAWRALGRRSARRRPVRRWASHAAGGEG
eukprot:scaffold21574_cov73-Isochrysis_galbana.AAC.1